MGWAEVFFSIIAKSEMAKVGNMKKEFAASVCLLALTK